MVSTVLYSTVQYSTTSALHCMAHNELARMGSTDSFGSVVVGSETLDSPLARLAHGVHVPYSTVRSPYTVDVLIEEIARSCAFSSHQTFIAKLCGTVDPCRAGRGVEYL